MTENITPYSEASRKPVALYARCSTTDQSTDLQVEAIRDYVKLRGWRVAEEYVDDGVSGAKSSRPALDRLVADARAGKFRVVVVHKLDRFGRSTVHMLSTIETLKDHGVAFASVSEGAIDTTSTTGSFVLSILAAVAQFERERIRERSLEGIARVQANGGVSHKTGNKIGRPKVPFQFTLATELLNNGVSESEVAKRLDVSRTTLRRRLSR
jgi:site-specific DNA recombinase